MNGFLVVLKEPAEKTDLVPPGRRTNRTYRGLDRRPNTPVLREEMPAEFPEEVPAMDAYVFGGYLDDETELIPRNLCTNAG